MIFFGHLGITTLTFKAYEKKYPDTIDYRAVLVGAVLPDIIDKPIGAYFFRSTFHNSRIFGHTLIFSVMLLMIGIYFWYKRKNRTFLILGFSGTIHLILDSMWIFPDILFWPYFGLKFPQRAEGDWFKGDILRLISDPSYYLPELIGFIIIAYFFIRLIRNHQVKTFLKTGKL